MVIDDTGSVEGIYAFIYCIKWRSGQVLPMPYGQTLKDSATQLFMKQKSGALVTQFSKYPEKRASFSKYPVKRATFSKYPEKRATF